MATKSISQTTTTSKFGGTRIPFENVQTLPPVKIYEAVSIHRDGSLRYYSLGIPIVQKLFKEEEVIAVIYNGMSGPTQPQVVVKDFYRYTSITLKPTFALRAVMARYVNRSLFTVSIYSVANATLDPVGYYKTVWATELALRAKL